jgi:hypothetical protein
MSPDPFQSDTESPELLAESNRVLGLPLTQPDTESPEEPALDKQVRLAAEERSKLPEYLRGKGLSVGRQNSGIPGDEP